MFKNRHPDLETPDSDLLLCGSYSLAEELGETSPPSSMAQLEGRSVIRNCHSRSSTLPPGSTSAALRKATSSPRSSRTRPHRPWSFLGVAAGGGSQHSPLTPCIRARDLDPSAHRFRRTLPAHYSGILGSRSSRRQESCYCCSPIYSSMLATPHPSLSTQKQI